MESQRLVYLTGGKLHVRGVSGQERVIESAFGRSLRDRAAQIQERHAWKTQGRGAQFMSGGMWSGGGTASRDPNEFRISITSACKGRAAGEILYTLETDEVSGMFAVNADGVEQRLFHTADFRLRDIAMGPDGNSIAASMLHGPMAANIAIMDLDANHLREATEGDSMDLAPRWVPGNGRRRLVFQSAGVGRNRAGVVHSLSPFTIQQLDLDSGELRTLVEEEQTDLLAPRMDEEGSIYYIRRPRPTVGGAPNPLQVIKAIVLLPFRLGFAIFQYVNFFSMMYTGKPLVDSKGGAARPMDMRQMIVNENLAKAMQGAQVSPDGEVQFAIPDSWQLLRRTAAGKTEVLAKSVVFFDLAPDGGVLYSTGQAAHYLRPGGKSEAVCSGKLIEYVAVV